MRNIVNNKWHIVSLIEVFESYDHDSVIVYENYYLINSKTLRDAKNRAFIIGNYTNNTECKDSNGKKGILKFYGISSITPVYGNLEDGDEILGTVHENIAKKDINKLVKYPNKLIYTILA